MASGPSYGGRYTTGQATPYGGGGGLGGMGGVYDQKLMEKYIGMGMRFILSGGDLSFLKAGAKARAEFLHGIKL